MADNERVRLLYWQSRNKDDKVIDIRIKSELYEKDENDDEDNEANQAVEVTIK